MKRIESIILSKYEEKVSESLRELKLGGFTIINGKGRGKAPRKVKEGLGRYVEPFNEVSIIVTVVDDSKADEVVSAIANAAHAGSLDVGKIFVSSVEELTDIATLKKGTEYL